MKNKLGMNDSVLRVVEKKIINEKIKLLDEYFTFNHNKLDFDYIKSLHLFLFSDFYFEGELGTRNINESELKKLNFLTDKINIFCSLGSEYSDRVLIFIKQIWHLQPFLVGNTRTMIAYLKVLNEAYKLNLNIDCNIKIINDPSIFEINNFVNQKRLTNSRKTDIINV